MRRDKACLVSTYYRSAINQRCPSENFQTSPQPVTDHFIITTRFEKNDRQITSLQAGERATMKITVNALKDAEYVLIEIHVPAGCTYSDRPQRWNGHKEFLKDKMVIFSERMSQGKI